MSDKVEYVIVVVSGGFVEKKLCLTRVVAMFIYDDERGDVTRSERFHGHFSSKSSRQGPQATTVRDCYASWTRLHTDID